MNDPRPIGVFFNGEGYHNPFRETDRSCSVGPCLAYYRGVVIQSTALTLSSEFCLPFFQLSGEDHAERQDQSFAAMQSGVQPRGAAKKMYNIDLLADRRRHRHLEPLHKQPSTV